MNIAAGWETWRSAMPSGKSMPKTPRSASLDFHADQNQQPVPAWVQRQPVLSPTLDSVTNSLQNHIQSTVTRHFLNEFFIPEMNGKEGKSDSVEISSKPSVVPTGNSSRAPLQHRSTLGESARAASTPPSSMPHQPVSIESALSSVRSVVNGLFSVSLRRFFLPHFQF
jgi:hypothetical protein